MSNYKYTIPFFQNSKNTIQKNISSHVNKVINNSNSNFRQNANKVANRAANFANNAKNKISNLGKDVSTEVKGLSAANVFGSLILILLIILVIILIFYVINYIFADCSEKKSLWNYLIDGSFNACTGPITAPLEKPSAPLIEREILHEKEVFHIANQDYTYEQAKCKAAAYGGRLATKSEIIEAYNKGADWCTYGWSAGQTAYYPTQKCSWNKLQQGPKERRNDCGRPGVNGGFFSNPKLKFGVNVYGIKPKGKQVREKEPRCTGKEFCEMRTNYTAANKMDTDEVVGFNEDSWSQYR